MVHYCKCSIFKNSNISLPILVIHAMLAEIERNLAYYKDFLIVKQKFSGTFVNKFSFHVKVKIEPPGQLQKKLYFIMECTISELLNILEEYLELNYLIFIEMCNVATYDRLKAKYHEKQFETYKLYPHCLFYTK